MYQVDVSRLTYFLVYEFKLFAPAQVGTLNTLAWLDTAANQATVSPQVASGLPPMGKIFVRSAFGQEEFETVGVDVEFLGNTKSALQARVYQTDSDLPFQSVLTLDAATLFAEPVVFDFRLMGMYLPTQEERVNHWVEIPSKFTAQDLCLIQCTAPGSSMWALFDTGAGLSVVNAKHLHEMGLALHPAYEIEIGDATGAKSVQEVALCSGLKLGGMPLPSFDCFVVDLQGIEDALGCQIDMILGANAMLRSGFRWLFDKPAGKVQIAT